MRPSAGVLLGWRPATDCCGNPRDDQENKEDEEEYLGDTGSGSGNTGKSEKGGQNRHNEEKECPC